MLDEKSLTVFALDVVCRLLLLLFGCVAGGKA